MLVWAREEVGYTVEQAADALGLSAETLLAAESNKHQLTLNQLRTAAEKYNCPFGFFYLSKPPYKKSFKPLPDYRLEPGLAGKAHYRLDLEIKKVRDRRLVFLDLAKSLDNPIKPFKILPKATPKSIGIHLRKRLIISNHELDSLQFDKVYSYWKSKIEEDGVLVYESQYLPKESGVIGAAIYTKTYPIILIKRGGDYNARKLFTLLHEYAHLLKGESAINDEYSQTVRIKSSGESSLEIECNRIAGETLIPSESINLSEYQNLDTTTMMEKLANSFKVTYSTAAVCLRRLNLVSQSELSQLLNIRRIENNKNKKAKEGKPVKIPRENLMRLDLGRPLFNLVLKAYSNGSLNIYDASKVLNLRVNKIDKLCAGSNK